MLTLSKRNQILIGLVLVGLMVATRGHHYPSEIISSGSFYFFSGRFTDPTVLEFSGRFAKYFPHSLTSLAIWVAAAALIHALIAATRGRHARA